MFVHMLTAHCMIQCHASVTPPTILLHGFIDLGPAALPHFHMIYTSGFLYRLLMLWAYCILNYFRLSFHRHRVTAEGVTASNRTRLKMKPDPCKRRLSADGIQFVIKRSFLKTMTLLKSCGFTARVFLKHKSKMTSDCCIFTFHRRGVDGKHLMRFQKVLWRRPKSWCCLWARLPFGTKTKDKTYVLSAATTACVVFKLIW